MEKKISCKKIERLIHKYVNSSRRKRRLGALELDRGLRSLARSHSKKMAKKKKIWHGDGVFQAKYRVKQSKGLWGFILSIFTSHSGHSGENVAMVPIGRVKGFKHSIRSSKDIAKAFHKMWMKSPGHKKNILNSRFYLIGLGIKKKGNYFYATEIFYS